MFFRLLVLITILTACIFAKYECHAFQGNFQWQSSSHSYRQSRQLTKRLQDGFSISITNMLLLKQCVVRSNGFCFKLSDSLGASFGAENLVSDAIIREHVKNNQRSVDASDREQRVQDNKAVGIGFECKVNEDISAAEKTIKVKLTRMQKVCNWQSIVSKWEQEMFEIKSNLARKHITLATNDEKSSLCSRLAVVAREAFSHGSTHPEVVRAGIEALHLHFSLQYQPSVERTTVISAIRSLSKTPYLRTHSSNCKNFHFSEGCDDVEDTFHGVLAFRLLKRLISGVGIRGDDDSQTLPIMEEKEICAVLKALTQINAMDLAYSLLRLQEQRPDIFPPVSAVVYSILIKGYANLLENEKGHKLSCVSKSNYGAPVNTNSIITHIETLLNRANENSVAPDVIFLNSVIDAYITLEAYERADIVFASMLRKGNNNDLNPNTRTYNIMLKGMAKRGQVKEATQFFAEMERIGKCDAISVNTLVNTMVRSGDFSMAESLLLKFTPKLNDTKGKGSLRRHPNVEAYTELLDGYAKANMLEQAFATFVLMEKRGVSPNVITYTCMVHALGIAFRTEKAQRILAQQQHIVKTQKQGQYYSKHEKDYTVMINSYLSGLLNPCSDNVHISSRFDEALSFCENLAASSPQTSTYLNAITAMTLIEGLSKCFDPEPRIITDLNSMQLIKSIINELDNYETVKVYTSLLQAYAMTAKSCSIRPNTQNLFLTHDSLFLEVQQVYSSIKDTGNGADVIAFNAYLDACCRVRRIREAFQEFDLTMKRIDRHNQPAKTTSTDRYSILQQQPNVATYTILISALLLNYDSRLVSARVQVLYRDMRKRCILPDAGLLDIILRSMLKKDIPEDTAIPKQYTSFLTLLLDDAETFSLYSDEDYCIRKRLVKLELSRVQNGEDEFLNRKGWNKVDSGFRFLGARSNESKKTDNFLESKGWNDVDSGFRII